jgi:hypothetical protein
MLATAAVLFREEMPAQKLLQRNALASCDSRYRRILRA